MYPFSDSLPSFLRTTWIYFTWNDQNCPDGALILPSDLCPSKFLVAPFTGTLSPITYFVLLYVFCLWLCSIKLAIKDSLHLFPLCVLFFTHRDLNFAIEIQFSGQLPAQKSSGTDGGPSSPVNYFRCVHTFFCFAIKFSKNFSFLSQILVEKCLLANVCQRTLFLLATSKNHSHFASLQVLISISD